MYRAVFLDRDGVINEKVSYLTEKKDVRLLPGSAEGIKRLNEAEYKVVIVTNQSAVARGMLTEAQLKALNTHLLTLLKKKEAKIDGVYYCPHHPDFTGPCTCRKPEAGLLFKAAEELHIDLTKSFMVGDTKEDVKAGRTAGCATILVRTGYGKAQEEFASADYVTDDLAGAVTLILEEIGK